MYKLTLTVMKETVTDPSNNKTSTLWKATALLTVMGDVPKEVTATYYGETAKQARIRAMQWVDSQLWNG